MCITNTSIPKPKMSRISSQKTRIQTKNHSVCRDSKVAYSYALPVCKPHENSLTTHLISKQLVCLRERLRNVWVQVLPQKGIFWALQTILPDPKLVQLGQRRNQESEPPLNVMPSELSCSGQNRERPPSFPPKHVFENSEKLQV